MAFALWTAVLLWTVEVSTGATIYEFLRENAGQPPPVGTVLMSSYNFGKLYVVIDNIHMVYMPRECFGATQHAGLRCELMTPNNEQDFIVVRRPQDYDSEKTVALAKRLLGVCLPYRFLTCNEYTWMYYIVYGSTSLMNRCPLARQLKTVPLEEIKSDNFSLWYPKGDGHVEMKLNSCDRFYLNTIGYQAYLVHPALRVEEPVGLPVPTVSPAVHTIGQVVPIVCPKAPAVDPEVPTVGPEVPNHQSSDPSAETSDKE